MPPFYVGTRPEDLPVVYKIMADLGQRILEVNLTGRSKNDPNLGDFEKFYQSIVI
jgi:uncharacterized protein Veg